MTEYEVRIYFQTEFLINPLKGIGLRTTYHPDGTVTKEEFPMCCPIMPMLIGWPSP